MRQEGSGWRNARLKPLPALRASKNGQKSRCPQGNRYADFVPSLDTVAAVGIGGLIAGKVAAKVGLIAMALVFLKKGAVVILLAGGWVVRKLFSRKDTSA